MWLSLFPGIHPGGLSSNTPLGIITSPVSENDTGEIINTIKRFGRFGSALFELSQSCANRVVHVRVLLKLALLFFELGCGSLVHEVRVCEHSLDAL